MSQTIMSTLQRFTRRELGAAEALMELKMSGSNNHLVAVGDAQQPASASSQSDGIEYLVTALTHAAAAASAPTPSTTWCASTAQLPAAHGHRGWTAINSTAAPAPATISGSATSHGAGSGDSTEVDTDVDLGDDTSDRLAARRVAKRPTGRHPLPDAPSRRAAAARSGTPTTTSEGYGLPSPPGSATSSPLIGGAPSPAGGSASPVPAPVPAPSPASSRALSPSSARAPPPARVRARRRARAQSTMPSRAPFPASVEGLSKKSVKQYQAALRIHLLKIPRPQKCFSCSRRQEALDENPARTLPNDMFLACRIDPKNPKNTCARCTAGHETCKDDGAAWEAKKERKKETRVQIRDNQKT
ncbi:hypothetical protein B0H63DRAFT_531233 [Podospora didyma]|uniref:Uncharacterized protein n=1 Tax=Podospora didyma TaxID=330526 RepID=A0AAE0P4X4_9PEZI|nr:hypothetical protein B0H63DRAFT_531233 [Podospora didyma]